MLRGKTIRFVYGKFHLICSFFLSWLAFELWNGITFWDELTVTVLNLTVTTILAIKLHFRRWIGRPTSNPIKYAYSKGFHFLQLLQRCHQIPEILFAREKPKEKQMAREREKKNQNNSEFRWSNRLTSIMIIEILNGLLKLNFQAAEVLHLMWFVWYVCLVDCWKCLSIQFGKKEF